MALNQYTENSIDLSNEGEDFYEKIKLNNAYQYLIKKMLTFTRNPLFFYRLRDTNVTMSLVIYIRELKQIVGNLYKFQKSYESK